MIVWVCYSSSTNKAIISQTRLEQADKLRNQLMRDVAAMASLKCAHVTLAKEYLPGHIAVLLI